HVGLTNIKIVYSRPSAKGRKIFGDLVPYNEYWRTGANRNTKINFSEDVLINSQTIKAGTYAIFTKPSEEEWAVYFYTDTTNWEVPKSIDPTKIAATLNVPSVAENRFSETLTISFETIKNSEVTLRIAWENTAINIPITVRTDEVMLQKIQQTRAKNALGYHLAGYYFLTQDKELERAKVLFERSIELDPEPDYRSYLQLAYVFDKLNDQKGVVEVATRSLELAKSISSKVGIEQSTALLKKWGAMD
ncbi:MAG: DUF2911 domain-containing protein, partial [Bacteroidota bacterium]